MINNFEQISNLLKWDSEDDFYFVQLMKRKKENKDLGSNSYVVKTYYISSLSHLEFYKEEMIMLSKFHNARVYINLQKRSYEKCALQTARIILDQVLNKDYKSSRKAFNSICGKYSADKEKKWIIDIDTKNDYDGECIIKEIDALRPEGNKFIAKIPTKNGYHIICKPFDIQAFNKLELWNEIDKPDIQKNNPTLLYC